MVSVSNDSMCCVCMEGFMYNTTQEDEQNEQGRGKELPCGHVYHPDCIRSWLSSSNRSCPLCRLVIVHSHTHFNFPA